MAPSPSGKARVCKTLITSSNLVGASIIIIYSIMIDEYGKGQTHQNLYYAGVANRVP